MVRSLQLVVLLAMFGTVAYAQEWRAELRRDAVTVDSAKMAYNEVGLYKIQVPGYQNAQIQVKVHSEAPAHGLISRDNFVSLTTLTFATVFITSFAEAYQVPASQFLQGVDYTELKTAIGTPDMELNLVMTNEGMQLEVVNTSSGQRTRQTMTWEQVFEK